MQGDRYILVGWYEDHDNTRRPNVEILASSDDYQELERIWIAIGKVDQMIIEGDMERDEPTSEVLELVGNELAGINMMDQQTGYVWEVHVLGIFEVSAGFLHPTQGSGISSRGK